MSENEIVLRTVLLLALKAGAIAMLILGLALPFINANDIWPVPLWLALSVSALFLIAGGLLLWIGSVSRPEDMKIF